MGLPGETMHTKMKNRYIDGVTKNLATRECLGEIQNVLSNTDVIEAGTKERAKTKQKF